MNFSVLFNPARTRVGGYLDTLKKKSGGYFGTNLGDFYTKAVQHIYDNTGKSTGVVEPDPEEPEDPEKPVDGDYDAVDVGGTVILGNFSGSIPYGAGCVYNDENNKISQNFYIDSDNDTKYDYQEVDWSNLKTTAKRTYKCWTYYEWTEKYYPLKMAYIPWLDNIKDIKVLPIHSNPWCADTDMDGLLDYQRREIIQDGNTITLCPIDPEPLLVTGPEYLWRTQGSKQIAEPIPTELGGSYVYKGHPLAFIYTFANPSFSTHWWLNQIITNFRDPVFTSVGSNALSLKMDNMNSALHSQVNTWQKVFGFNELYNAGFRLGTKNNVGIDDFDFYDENNDKYRLWIWRGDYLNLGGGTEMGIYKCGNPYGIDLHWDSAEFLLPMTLSLYNYSDDTYPDTIFRWAPTEHQWWITGFKPEFADVDQSKMATIGSIDFSEYPDMYASFKRTNYDVDKRQNLIFDDEKQTVWVMWWGENVK